MNLQEIKSISIQAYDYRLPEEKIAFHPKENREDSKLLVYEKGIIANQKFSNLPNLLSSDDVLVFNNTRVINARLWFQKPTGKIIEIFCLEPKEQEIEKALSQTNKAVWNCLVGGAKRWKQNPLEKKVNINGNELVVKANKGEFSNNSFAITFEWDSEYVTFSEILETLGNTPLPPYIKRENTLEDESRYQTVYSEFEGSVAAPTAGLHFSDDVLAELAKRGIDTQFLTLHVGAGTFKPVTDDTIGEHEMHFEVFEVSSEFLQNMIDRLGKRIIPVGTTSCRTLESLYWLGCKLILGKIDRSTSSLKLTQWEAYSMENHNIPIKKSLEYLLQFARKRNNKILGKTQLMIAPGYNYKIANGLITNFHLPKSTLLLLVSAMVGDNWKTIYEHAKNQDYRFLSYGDSSLLIP